MKNLLLVVAVALIGACANYTPKAEKDCCAEAEAKGSACCAEMSDCASKCEDMAAMQCCKDAAALGKECASCKQ